MTLLYQTLLSILLADNIVVYTLPQSHSLRRSETLVCDEAKTEKNCIVSSASILTYEADRLLKKCPSTNESLSNPPNYSIPENECDVYNYQGSSMFDFRLVEQTKPKKFLAPTNLYYFQEGLPRQKIEVSRDCTHIGESCAKITHYFFDSAKRISRTSSITTHPTGPLTDICNFDYKADKLILVQCPARGTVPGIRMYEIFYESESIIIKEFYIAPQKERLLLQTTFLNLEKRTSIVKVLRTERQNNQLSNFIEKYYY